MEQKKIKAPEEQNEEGQEYLDYVKSSVKDGTYFKDALNWYFFRYVTPICDRTMLIFGAIIAAVVLFFLVEMIKSAFPLVEDAPIFIRAGDRSTSYPNLIKLKYKKGEEGYDQNITTVDEAVVKYLLKVYVDNRESYDFSKAEVEKVNEKFNHIKNSSSAEEYKIFQIVMSKDNPSSPINYFGHNVQRFIEIESIKLIKKENHGFADRAKGLITKNIPTEAEIRFISTMQFTSLNQDVKKERERFIVKIKFDFSGVKKNGNEKLSFIVSSYRLFRIK